MLQEFSYLGEEKAMEVVVTNTRAIADMVETFDLLPKGKLFPPRLENSEEDLNRLVWDKVHELYGHDPPPPLVDRPTVDLGRSLATSAGVCLTSQTSLPRPSGTDAPAARTAPACPAHVPH